MTGYVPIATYREGKRATSWTNPQQDYESGLIDFVRNILDPKRSPAFIESMAAIAARAALLGALNSLGQLTLKLTLPGVPDFYQGTELWDFSLVDPDNRRPVDFDLRRTLAKGAADWVELVETWRDGRIKMQVMRRLLAIRREHASLFRDGDYTTLRFEGADANRMIGFARTHKRQRMLVIVGRHFSAGTNGGRQWPSTFSAQIEGETLANYRNLLDPNVPAGMLAGLPAAVLGRR